MFIGRDEELKILTQQLKKDHSSFVAVYGRRRIGKTEMVRHFINQNNYTSIEFTGVYGASKQVQLDNMMRKIQKASAGVIKPSSKIKEWNEVFYLLEDYIEILDDGKKIIFIDEFPWLDTHKSGFLGAFSYFWNDFCTRRDDIVLIICGSAASYIINKVINNNKTLHNRITAKINMQQFNLAQTKELLTKNGCRYSNKSIIDTYITLGGVAKYLTDIDCTKQQIENINFQCFSKNGLLTTEYNDLYESLFKNHQVHYKIMDLLTNKWNGYTQKEIINAVHPSSAVKNSLDELELSGFITSITKFGQLKREKVYRATDCFSFFYNKWMKNNKIESWNNIAISQPYKIWSGFAFENICHMHSYEIKKALDIGGVPSLTHYWNYIPKNKDEKGAQIDMLIEYTNGSKDIDIIECKYTNSVFVITKTYYEQLKSKISIFNTQTNNKYNIRLIFVTTNGVEENEYYNEIIQKQITIDDIL